MIFKIKSYNVSSLKQLVYTLKGFAMTSTIQSQKIFLEIPSVDARREITLLEKLGGGGSKTAYKISDDEALLLSNNLYPSIWHRIVNEDYAMSQFLQSVGLLGQNLEKVKLFDDLVSQETPRYALKAESFDSLRRRNIIVIDTKNTTYFDKKFFKTQEEIENPDNWLPLMSAMKKDIAKIIHYQLPTGGDSFNFAYVLRQESDLRAQRELEAQSFEMRYYGFDYTLKSQEMKIPKTTPISQLKGLQYLSAKVKSFANKFFACKCPPLLRFMNRNLLAKIDRVLDHSLTQLILEEIRPGSYWWALNDGLEKNIAESLRKKLRYEILTDILDLQAKEHVSKVSLNE